MDKWAMLGFGIVFSVSSGVAASIHLLAQSQRWLLIFPAWNLIVSYALLYQLNQLDHVANSDVESIQVLILSAIVLGLVGFCNEVLQFHLAVIFSIAVSYALSVNRLVEKVYGLIRKSVNV